MPLRILLAALLCASTQADAQISRQAAAKVKTGRNNLSRGGLRTDERH
jgi:hypothetical protein